MNRKWIRSFLIDVFVDDAGVLLGWVAPYATSQHNATEAIGGGPPKSLGFFSSREDAMAAVQREVGEVIAERTALAVA